MSSGQCRSLRHSEQWDVWLLASVWWPVNIYLRRLLLLKEPSPGLLVLETWHKHIATSSVLRLPEITLIGKSWTFVICYTSSNFTWTFQGGVLGHFFFFIFNVSASCHVLRPLFVCRGPISLSGALSCWSDLCFIMDLCVYGVSKMVASASIVYPNMKSLIVALHCLDGHFFKRTYIPSCLLTTK